jgi:hypothetical protein
MTNLQRGCVTCYKEQVQLWWSFGEGQAFATDSGIGLKRGHLWQRIGADRLQLGNAGTVDFLERREPISRQGAVVG